jgi:hypothetical protein
VAISGTSHRNSYTRIYQESSSSSSSQWNLIGEIQGVRYGGSNKLNAGGTRLVMGTVASEGWRCIVQVFDRIIQSDTQTKVSTWTRVGQPIVGAKPLEMWGGDVELSADGDLLVVTSQNGDTHRVQAYQLSTDEPQMWIPYGQELTGTGNQYEHYGADLALSVDGKILAVGAPGDIDLYNSKLSGKSISSLTNHSFQAAYICTN